MVGFKEASCCRLYVIHIRFQISKSGFLMALNGGPFLLVVWLANHTDSAHESITFAHEQNDSCNGVCDAFVNYQLAQHKITNLRWFKIVHVIIDSFKGVF